jgi:trimeric autotransporter adhesin
MFVCGPSLIAGRVSPVFSGVPGVNWTNRASNSTNQIFSVEYLNGNFWATATATSGAGLQKSADGITWTAVTMTKTGVNLQDIAYGNSTYVICGTADTILTSTDGSTWTDRSGATGTQHYYSITYGNGLFVMVGGTSNNIRTSPDGITWTNRASLGAGVVFKSVCYGGNMFVAAGDSGVLYSSPDGVTWTSRTSNLGTTTSDAIYSVEYAVDKFIATSTAGRISTSTNGTAWTVTTLPSASGLNVNDIVYVNGYYVAALNSSSVREAWVSSDLTTWNRRTIGSTHQIVSLTATSGIVVGVGGLASGGNGASIWTAPTNSVLAAPDAPTVGTVTVSGTTATVPFTAPANDGGSTITNYVATSNPGALTGSGGTSPLTVTGLTPGVAYTFTVAAVNSVGTGSSSSASNSVTPATVPGAPTIGTATAGDASASVTFTAPASNGGSAITGYTVTSSPGGITATGTSSPINVTGLTNGTAYTFTVTATNAIGTSAASAATSAVTPAAAGGGTTDSQFSNVAMLLHAEGANGGTTITDTKGNVTLSSSLGSVTTSTTQKMFGSSALRFDGSSRLDTTSNAAFTMGTGDFTVEMFVRTDATLSNYTWFFGTPTGNGLDLAWYVGGQIKTFIGGSLVTIGNWTPSGGTWYHLALVRVSGTVTLYVDGTSVGSVLASTSITTDAMRLGMQGGSGASYPLTGYLDEVRVTKGVARYTSNFSVPASAFPDSGPTASDSNWSSVSMLLHGEGTNAGTVFTDSASKFTFTNTGSSTSTTASKFGSSSIRMTGSSNLLSSSNAALTMGTGDFTIEGWFRFDAAPGVANQFLFGGSGSNAMDVRWNGSTLQAFIGTANFSAGTPPTINANTFYHIALVRTGTTGKLFFNGTEIASSTAAGVAANITLTQMYIGAQTGGSTMMQAGYIDDFRVTKGVARYTTGFTVPSAAFPDTGPAAAVTWNPSDKNSDFVLSNGNLTALVSGATTGIARATVGKSTGKWYWEVKPAAGSFTMFGVAQAGHSLSAYVGSTIRSYYNFNGNKYDTATTAYGASYSSTDTVGVALDMDSGTLTFYKNGVSQGTAFTGLTGTWYPSVTAMGDAGDGGTANFGATAFTHTPPSGFVALS